ncbi:hypothetical protein ZEAMMB73_Zm00001d024914 [Zea mays]|uniref:Uncharacterized protein n=1 Tax=Zea mays TaxID=4577 RepID=A0A1D6J2Q3_MAIZE|nr:hypothetical protein ZEAMMB73_Zm00001d024914 [Zea mays]
MALIMLIGNGSTTCHAVWHLVHAPLPVAPVTVPGIPVVTKPSIVPVATLPLMLDIPMVLTVGVVPQIHVVPNTAALPPMSAPVLAVMTKVTLLPMLVVVPKVGAFPPMPVVMPKVPRTRHELGGQACEDARGVSEPENQMYVRAYLRGHRRVGVAGERQVTGGEQIHHRYRLRGLGTTLCR